MYAFSLYFAYMSFVVNSDICNEKFVSFLNLNRNMFVFTYRKHGTNEQKYGMNEVTYFILLTEPMFEC